MSQPMKVRNSERSAWKTCRWRWSWTYKDGLQAREAPNALRFGDLVHQALAAYYKAGEKRGPHPARTFERLYNEQAAALDADGFDVWSDEKWVNALPLGTGMLEGYVEEFKERDKAYRVVSSEQTFQRRVRAVRPADAPTSWPGVLTFTVVGTLDGVWLHIDTGRILFKEFKTAASISLDGLAMDEQPSLYWTYGPRWLQRRGIIPAKQLPREILYTFLRKAVPDDDRAQNADGAYLNKPSKGDLLAEYISRTGLAEPPKGCNNVNWLTAWLEGEGVDVPQLGEPSAKQPAPFFHREPIYRNASDRARLHERVVQEAFEINAARRGLISIYKNPGPLHMPNCRGCAVRDACEVHEAGGDFQSVLNSTTVPWNPYAAHELPERS